MSVPIKERYSYLLDKLAVLINFIHYAITVVNDILMHLNNFILGYNATKRRTGFSCMSHWKYHQFKRHSNIDYTLLSAITLHLLNEWNDLQPVGDVFEFVFSLKVWVFWLTLHKCLFLRVHCNDLVQSRQQAINCTRDDSVHWHAYGSLGLHGLKVPNLCGKKDFQEM